MSDENPITNLKMRPRIHLIRGVHNRAIRRLRTMGEDGRGAFIANMVEEALRLQEVVDAVLADSARLAREDAEPAASLATETRAGPEPEGSELLQEDAEGKLSSFLG